MAYDRSWARLTYEKYSNMRPRAHQINLCLMQLITTESGEKWLETKLIDCLIDSIQGKSCKELWPWYKRLVKKSPLDQKLLYKVARNFCYVLKDDSKQLSLF
jgi:hypothetical protein